MLFFKLRVKQNWEVPDATPGRLLDNLEWYNFKTIARNGRVFFMKRNKHIQITTTDQVEFYEFNEATCEPYLTNVVNNFMECSVMMYGGGGKYCVTYKSAQKEFDVYKRKYVHDFKVQVEEQNFEGSKGLFFENDNCLIINQGNRLRFYDAEKFTEYKSHMLEVPLRDAESTKVKN